MVSVLIPVYNTDVRSFVKQLTDQLSTCGGEVICIDDCSLPEFRKLNSEIAGNPQVTYLELENNIGRSRIRNLLAKKTNHNWMIFVDGDSSVSSPHFIQRYLNYLTDPKQVIYGGTNYGEQPSDTTLLLHWLYGNKRECVSAVKRNRNRFGTFKTNNFMVHKSVFEKMGFNENVKGYGHEDTLFAKDLERNGFSILHIENPLQHDGLEKNTVFLEKQHHAIKNLAELYKQGLVGNEIRLIRFYRKVKSFGLMLAVRKFYLRDKDLIYANLLSPKPNLTNLDRLKLGWFIELIR